MTYTTDNATQQALEAFRKFDVDTQLALLWYGYLDIKDELNPGPGPSVTQPAQALYDQIQQLSQEEQLQAQRDIAACAGTPISQAYTALASSAQLELWLLLGQGMEQGNIIQVPESYNLPENTKDFVNNIKGLSFEQRINFSRSAVAQMGTKPHDGDVEAIGTKVRG